MALHRQLKAEEKLAYGIFPPDNKLIFYPISVLSEGTARRVATGKKSSLHEVYSPENIEILLNKCEKNDKEGIVVRFLLRNNGKLVFGEEGAPFNTIPAHYELTENSRTYIPPQELNNLSCLSAGNAFFNEKHELIKIDNKSGDFRPKFDSLQFALDAFFSSGAIKFSDKLILIDVNEGKDHTLKTAEYKSNTTIYNLLDALKVYKKGMQKRPSLFRNNFEIKAINSLIEYIEKGKMIELEFIPILLEPGSNILKLIKPFLASGVLKLNVLNLSERDLEFKEAWDNFNIVWRKVGYKNDTLIGSFVEKEILAKSAEPIGQELLKAINKCISMLGNFENIKIEEQARREVLLSAFELLKNLIVVEQESEILKAGIR